MNGVLGNIWEESVVMYVKVMYRSLPEGTEKNHEKPKSGEPMSLLRFKTIHRLKKIFKFWEGALGLASTLPRSGSLWRPLSFLSSVYLRLLPKGETGGALN
jgi:hypothetical protein